MHQITWPLSIGTLSVQWLPCQQWIRKRRGQKPLSLQIYLGGLSVGLTCVCFGLCLCDYPWVKVTCSESEMLMYSVFSKSYQEMKELASCWDKVLSSLSNSSRAAPQHWPEFRQLCLPLKGTQQEALTTVIQNLLEPFWTIVENNTTKWPLCVFSSWNSVLCVPSSYICELFSWLI